MDISKAKERGFTLVEVIVSLVLIGILAAIAGIGLVKITEGYLFARQNTETIIKAQIAMTRMIKELGAVTAISAGQTATSVTYTRPGPVTNTIARSGSTIQINGNTLIDRVTAFALAYYDGAGNVTATAANIRRIDLNFTVTGADGHPSTFANRIDMREAYW